MQARRTERLRWLRRTGFGGGLRSAETVMVGRVVLSGWTCAAPGTVAAGAGPGDEGSFGGGAGVVAAGLRQEKTAATASAPKRRS